MSEPSSVQCVKRHSFANKNKERVALRFTFSKISRIWSLQVVVSERTIKKGNKINNGRAETLFFSLPMFGDFLAAVSLVGFQKDINNVSKTTTALFNKRRKNSRKRFSKEKFIRFARRRISRQY